jgi:hypothetical protein
MKRWAVYALLLAACSTADRCNEIARADAERALKYSGFVDANVRDVEGCRVALNRCSRGDNYVFEFTARNVRGDRVAGYVCCGDTKGCTVRF